MMGYGFSGAMFSVIPTIVMIGFIIIFGIIVVRGVQGAARWNTNNQSPELTVDAVLVTKRTQVSVHGQTADVAATSSTRYFVTFEVDSGDRMEFHVPAQEYGMLVEGDTGKLTFQGTRYKGFVRDGLNL